MSGDPPAGWSVTRLQDVLQPGGLFDGPFGSNLKTSDYTGSGVRVVRLENLANLRFIEEKRTYISRAKYKALTKHSVAEGDILFGSFLDDAVRVCVMPRLPVPAIAKADCFCIRPRPDLVDARFLMYQLGRSATRDALIEEIHGATRPRVTTKQLRQLEILVPPLSAQKQIVETIDALLTKVNVARECLIGVREILKRFRQAVLSAACSGRLTEDWRAATAPPSERDALADVNVDSLPSRWQLLPARSVLTDARYGTSAKCDRESTNGVPVLRVPNIAAGKVDLTDLKFAPRHSERDWSQRMLHAGDIIVCRTNGSLDLVGKAAVVPALPRAFSFASYLIRLRPNTTLVEPNYLHAVVSSPYGREQLTADARTTAGQYNVNLKILGDLRVPLPPPEEQYEINRRVRGLFALADAIEERLTQPAAAADALPRAILAEAFRGEW